MSGTLPTTLIFGAESAFNGPAEIIDSVEDIGLANTGNFSPFSNATGLPIVNQNSIVPPVSCLSNNGCPSTIFRTITKRIINAVNGVLTRRPEAHIGKEGWERISPAIADKNTPSAVILEFVRVMVGASIHHPAPSSVFVSPLSVSSASMLCGSGADPFALKTPTGRNGSAFKVSGKDCLGVATFTQTIPQRHFGGSKNLAAGIANHPKPSKFLAGQVLELLVRWDRVMKDCLRNYVSSVHVVLSAATKLQLLAVRFFSQGMKRQSTEAFA